jgi:hypothetical protein
MQPDLPKTAQQFVAFMESVWSDNSEPSPNGGIIMYTSPLYDEWHNAVHAAQRCGMFRTGTTNALDGTWCGVYRFPNEPWCGVRITNDGNAVKYTAHHYGRKRAA